MNRWIEEMLEALVREIRREAEEDLVRCLKTARRELEELRCADAGVRFEPGELGQLEEVQ